MNKAVGEVKKKIEKKEVKVAEEKREKKLKGDSGVDCHYCNGANHLANDCMLRKKDEKKNKVKDEAYYTESQEEVRAKAKGMYLVAKGEQKEDGTYQIWSSGSDDDEMRNPTHGAMCAKCEDDYDEEIIGQCFVSKSANKSLMTTKVRSILEYFNIPLNAYNSEIVSLDATVAYLDSLVVSASKEAKKLSTQMLET